MGKIEKRKSWEILSHSLLFFPTWWIFAIQNLQLLATSLMENIISQKNSIPVPMRYGVGNTMTIKYNVEKPTEIFPRHYFVI